LRLTRENQSILGRITQRKPEYSADSWAKQWEEDQKFMDNISHFPKNWWLMKVRGLIDWCLTPTLAIFQLTFRGRVFFFRIGQKYAKFMSSRYILQLTKLTLPSLLTKGTKCYY
jgi:hypothetical protein